MTRTKPAQHAGSLRFELRNLARPSCHLQWAAFSIALKMFVDSTTNQLPLQIKRWEVKEGDATAPKTTEETKEEQLTTSCKQPLLLKRIV